MLSHRFLFITSALALAGLMTLACDALPGELHDEDPAEELEVLAADPDLDSEPGGDDEAEFAVDIDELQAPPAATMAPLDTSDSYLDDAARAYLEEAGMFDVGSIGATMWVDACSVSAHQGAGTFNSGKEEFCFWSNALPGWVIVDTAYIVRENRNNRGSASVSTTNGPVTISSEEFGAKFGAAIGLSSGAGDTASTKKLELEYQRLNGYSFKFDGQGNQLIGKVTANGGLFEGSKIAIQARARLLRVH